MQIRKSHRILAAVLTLVMLVGLLPTAAFAKSAGNDGSAEMNEAYGAHESLMPIGPSFNVDTLLEWTPESDPDAVYSRASIPLADRVGGFVVTPKVNPEAKKYEEISIQEVIDQKLAAVDLTASILCMENKMPMLVFGLNEENSIAETMSGTFTGTKVTV